jgi:hypothetical protein
MQFGSENKFVVDTSIRQQKLTPYGQHNFSSEH